MSVHIYKQEADTAYKRGDFNTAEALYTKALQETPDDLRLWTNRAQTFLQLQRWADAVEDCTVVLNRDSTHLKALFRRGRAYAQLGRIKEAQEDWKHLLILQPENQVVIQALNELEKNKNNPKQIKNNEEETPCIRKKIFIKEVDVLPSWAQNDSKHFTNTQTKSQSWENPETPTLQILTQKLRATDDTETARYNRFMYFFSIDATILPQLFGAAGLEGAFLETFLHAIKYAYSCEENRELWWNQSLSLLKQLSSCSRFDIAILFVRKSTLEQLDQLFQKAASEEGGKPYQVIWNTWILQKK
ncbi:hypothetical protein PORY_000333 [Pneumocystis oryctolagi]|uniref:Uncharacterized protein n=1 Tax=Pneumocystis oryctolagi TaxID=42067 RepID=A0ACB7CG14_9ASCO|nr:hypothetical protein PORY_000333 [Pneumocystis oryctolagi]